MEFQQFSLCTVGSLAHHRNSLASDLSSHFSFSQSFGIITEPMLPQILHVSGVGDMTIPISLQNVERLKESAVPSTFGQGLNADIAPLMRSSYQIDAGRINISSPQNMFHEALHSWMKLALNQSKIDVDAIGAEAHFKKMLLYQSGGHYARHQFLTQETGHFATMILQIPVEGGYEGGRLNIEHHQKIRSFDLSINSTSDFYITVVHAESQLQVERVSNGCKMELVFYLLWNPPTVTLYPPLPDISSFLVALTKIREETDCWLQQSKDSDSPPKMLVIGLEHNYDPNRHSFATLLGQDRLVAYLVRSTGLLEVYLACLIRQETGLISQPITVLKQEDWRRCKIKMRETIRTNHTVSHWIGVDSPAVQFQGLNMDTQSQFVGPVFKPGAKAVRQEPMEENPTWNNVTLNCWYHQSVLILWPKSTSFYFDLHHRFDYLLDQMERDLSPDSMDVLKKIVLKSSEWTITGLRICRLLNLCLRFHAREEALQLLQLLVDQSIGIPSDDVAYLIAELECKLLGWTSCYDLINKLMACKPVEQIDHFAALSEAFLDRRAIAGFEFVSNEIWKIFQTHVNGPITFNRLSLLAIVKVLIRMEERAEVYSCERFNQFIAYFVQLNILQMCHLVIDLQHICQRSEAGKNVLLCLCFHVLDKVDPSDGTLEICIQDLVRCFAILDPHEPDVLDLLTKKLCQASEDPIAFNPLLRKLASSLHILHQNLRSDVSQRFLDARIAQLQSLHQPTFTWEQKKAKFPAEYPEVLTFLQSSEEKIFVKFRFAHVREARDFQAKYFGVMDDCVQQGYSAMADVLGKGKATKCQIIKTRHVYLAECEKFESNMQELRYLLELRATLGFQPPDVSMAASKNISDLASSSLADETHISKTNESPGNKRLKTTMKRAGRKKK